MQDAIDNSHVVTRCGSRRFSGFGECILFMDRRASLRASANVSEKWRFCSLHWPGTGALFLKFLVVRSDWRCQKVSEMPTHLEMPAKMLSVLISALLWLVWLGRESSTAGKVRRVRLQFELIFFITVYKGLNNCQINSTFSISHPDISQKLKSFSRAQKSMPE